MRINLLEKVRKTIRAYGMLGGGENVLVALSGGADSMALLLCLHSLAPEFGLTLKVAHLNHGIRGAEADADEDFARATAAGLSLPFISERIDVKSRAGAEKRNLEELARELRYDFLSRAARAAGAAKIAVGHNLNDQAETAFFRFIRGSGSEGLSAIHPVVEGILIRPLLECSREEILEYLRLKQAGYREDSTNKSYAHARNRIRGELFPYLQEHFNPRLVATLARQARLARETWSYVEFEAKRAYAAIASETPEGPALDAASLVQLHPTLAKEVIRLALRERRSLRRVGSHHIEGILEICRTGQSGAKIDLPGSYAAERQFGRIVLKEKGGGFEPFSYPLPVPGRCTVPEARAVFTCAPCRAPGPDEFREKAANRAFLDASLLTGALTVRSRMPGDRYGGPGRRKVKKMLIGSRIPLPQRAVLPMIVAGGSVVWIPGFRPARGFEARPGTAECLMIAVETHEAFRP